MCQIALAQDARRRVNIDDLSYPITAPDPETVPFGELRVCDGTAELFARSIKATI